MSNDDEIKVIDPASSRPIPAKPTIYSAPRRFDLSTMLTVTTAYAAFFAIMKACSATDFIVLWAGASVTLVGLAQAVLFGGNSPRASSLFAGGVIVAATMLLTVSRLSQGYMLFSFIWGGLWGSLFGYLTGALIGGLFLVADSIRRRLEP